MGQSYTDALCLISHQNKIRGVVDCVSWAIFPETPAISIRSTDQLRPSPIKMKLRAWCGARESHRSPFRSRKVISVPDRPRRAGTFLIEMQLKFRVNESIFGSNDESKRNLRSLGIKRVKFGT